MEIRHLPIETSVGIIRGRDAIYLDQVFFDKTRQSIELCGEINGRLCSKNDADLEWIKYSLTFSGILFFTMTELDFAEPIAPSSFIEIKDSSVIQQMRKADSAKKLTSSHKHFQLQTYDDVFEIVCRSFELKIFAKTE